MSLNINGNVKKLYLNGDINKRCVGNALVFSAEQIVIPNTFDYPQSAYDTSLLNYGGTLTVDNSGAKVNTWNTDSGRKHLVCLKIEVSGYNTLTYTATTTGTNNDSNYKTTIGFGTAIAENLNVLNIANQWTGAFTKSGTLNVTNYETIYAIFGQGTTAAGGNYGHGTTGFTSIVLT